MKREMNGASLIKEHVPGMNTVMLGISVPVGASADTPGSAGMAHLCEHLRAASCNWRLGGDRLRRLTLEAFTEREETFFLIRALREDAPVLLEWLTHFFTAADIPAADFEREKAVVLDEALTLECSEIERIDRAFMATGYSGTDYCRPVVGGSEEIAALEIEPALAFLQTHYRRSGVVVVVLGDLDGMTICEDVASVLAGVTFDGARAPPTPTPYNFQSGCVEVDTSLGMSYFLKGLPAFERSSDDRIDLYAISAYLGDDIDSLLFRKLRLERALLYNIKTEYHLFRSAGHLVVKGMASNDKFRAVLECLDEILDGMRSWMPDRRVVDTIQHSLTKALMINLDEPRNKLLRLLKHDSWFSRYFTVGDDLAAIRGITADGLRQTSERIFQRPSLLCYGV